MAPQLSTGKKLLYGSITAALVLGGTELGLRATWGQPPPSDMVARLSQCEIRLDGDRGGLDCHPGEREDVSISAAPERPRVVVLGGSSVRESHDVSKVHNFPAMLGLRIPEIEVVNFGATGLTVANVARLASELEGLSPDLVIIYSGHNDYNGDVFRGAIQGTRLWMLPLHRLLERSWIHGLIARRPQGTPRGQRPMARVIATEDDLALQLRDDIDARYASDLKLAVNESPAPVLLCTLLRNPDHPPSGVLVRDRPRCADALHGLEGPARDPKRRAREGAEVCEDTSLHWWLQARALRAGGDDEAATEAWYRSLDLDALPLRAPASADPIIRQVANDTDATLVDLEATLGPMAPASYFSDTLHLTREGADAIAAQLEPAVRSALGL